MADMNQEVMRKNTYKKEFLTDGKVWFNPYYVTDANKLDKNTKHTYFVTRGSDGLAF
ncbi:hypothetical protein ACQ3MN_07740 [Enterococcus faecalis]|uniref:hypothetical protein n=1 Tax=Enterococcus faecalis TaxID=1351 RepID=UPI003D76F6BF